MITTTSSVSFFCCSLSLFPFPFPLSPFPFPFLPLPLPLCKPIITKHMWHYPPQIPHTLPCPTRHHPSLPLSHHHHGQFFCVGSVAIIPVHNTNLSSSKFQECLDMETIWAARRGFESKGAVLEERNLFHCKNFWQEEKKSPRKMPGK